MKTFNVGALRQAMGELRLNGASDLVQRTLAQHGLSLPGQQAGFQPPFAAPAARAPADPVPPGATLTSDRFACAAGSRDYLAYVPASADKGIRGMVVMLHGCTQDPADFARGTGMNALAEEHRLVALYPHQSRGENAQSCWNWFSAGDQRRGRGEPEILAQMTLDLASRHDVPRDRIFVAGLSAGAAMAVILGQTHPDVFAAVGAHSGLPFGAARDVPSAFAAMSGQGAPEAPGRRDAVPTPTIVFHGSADRTVHPLNGDRIAGATLAAGPVQTMLDKQTGTAGTRRFTRETTTLPDGRVLLDHWRIDGLGHAWSGGKPGGSYTDPQGPDASAEMVRFFLAQGQATN
ncbi:PHB depolymerase family esterase [Paracoccus sp. YIM 132242]|uniref:PHB depolymerase family esterase n=1 Tax=Paracoccus lichenicola TaxID=2665644 RepID=A0A6L6HTK6_9RHOB|nr:PHB depolymerase family esterase [Paracoccus lichenicola]MTE01581.1 PHB depolymerase family esterase [Paracoccus lichenicola]